MLWPINMVSDSKCCGWAGYHSVTRILELEVIYLCLLYNKQILMEQSVYQHIHKINLHSLFTAPAVLCNAYRRRVSELLINCAVLAKSLHKISNSVIDNNYGVVQIKYTIYLDGYIVYIFDFIPAEYYYYYNYYYFTIS